MWIDMAEYFKWGTASFILAILCVFGICIHSLIVDESCSDCTDESIVNILVEYNPPYFEKDIPCTYVELLCVRLIEPYMQIDYDEFMSRDCNNTLWSSKLIVNNTVSCLKMKYDDTLHKYIWVMNICNETTAHNSLINLVEICELGNELIIRPLPYQKKKNL